ncbi:MAG: phosphatidylserine/phosphatidylglycerophosphate/cardiolipin synthase family protein [Bdellovibrionaceae bacterium]|nr:phosphatidylserine/phosphatidylglycerophosphate/cardiolipin synthase family protein [Bdellovibrionales bacterium]MCB9084248.1 phosphatidylserine/phosphatidylglycerophosphate/cardiolipin synthase family protein [Pseudobdellovibrionaceae bacterium]
MENGAQEVKFEVAWKSEELFLTSRVYFSRMLEECRRATQSIDIEVYIFEDDRAGNELLHVLEQAVERGVRVRILVDGIGTPNWVNKQLETLPAHGIETRVYHPVPRPFSRFWWFLFPRFWRTLRFFLSANRRNHKKVFLIDSKVAFVGGINVSESSLEWCDTGVRVEGEGVDLLEEAFEENWQRGFYFGKKTLREFMRRGKRCRVLSPWIHLNSTLTLRRQRMRDLIKRFERATDRIWVANPYWVPGPLLIRAFIGAARRGVDVRLCYPEKTDVVFTRWVNELLLGPLIPFGVKLFVFQRGFLHAKAVIVDQWGKLGSSNLNARSIYHDLEADAVLSKNENLEKLVEWFEGNCRGSKHIALDELDRRPFMERLGARFVLLFKRWI